MDRTINMSRIQPSQVRHGLIGYVDVSIRGYSGDVQVLCEIVDVNHDGTKLEIVVLASDRSCVWIPMESFYIRT